MIDALLAGKLIKDPSLRTGPSGKPFCQFLLSCHTGEEQPVVVSGIAFGEVAERIAKLGKADSLAVIGSLHPSEWQDKNTNELKHGLSVTASNVLTAYDVKKRRLPPKAESAAAKTPGNEPHSFDAPLDF